MAKTQPKKTNQSTTSRSIAPGFTARLREMKNSKQKREIHKFDEQKRKRKEEIRKKKYMNPAPGNRGA